MTQNRSPAVMQQRHEPHDSLDYFPTPPWATRALTEWLGTRMALHLRDAWEPACGEGHMARPLAEAFNAVRATDLLDYGWPGQGETQDFLLDWPGSTQVAPDWIITNPPFKLAEAFIRRGLDLAEEGVAVLVRTSFLESEGRYDLFRDCRPWAILQFAERVVMWKGRLMDPNVAILNAKTGKMEKPTTATSYCWIVWRRDFLGPTEFHWIPPGRARLERPGDYPAAAPEPMTLPLEPSS
jgi:hypothetical protein